MSNRIIPPTPIRQRYVLKNTNTGEYIDACDQWTGDLNQARIYHSQNGGIRADHHIRFVKIGLHEVGDS